MNPHDDQHTADTLARALALPPDARVIIARQLLESLGDSDASPAPPWQLDEAQRRSAAAKEDPSSLLSEEDFWRAVDAKQSATRQVSPLAVEDLKSAEAWYEDRSPGSSDGLRSQIAARVSLLRVFPRMGESVVAGIRRVLLKRYPYVVLYEASDQELVVLGIFHTAQDASVWQRRLVDEQRQVARRLRCAATDGMLHSVVEHQT